MVIGNGLMAKAFKSYHLNNDIVIFASGVSNSTETNANEFEREFNLLKSTISNYPNSTLVYFSTCSIEDQSVKGSLYVTHKLAMEHFIATNIERYIVFRVTNVVGKIGNAKTLINYLVCAIKNNEVISLWQNAERNIIDIDDVKFIVDYVLQNSFKNEIINVAFRKSFLVKDIVSVIEQFLSKKAHLKMIDKGNKLKIDTLKIADALSIIEEEKSDDLLYILNLLKKYYS